MIKQKQELHECPKCHSLKTTKDTYGFRCLKCGAYIPQTKGQEKKQVEVQG